MCDDNKCVNFYTLPKFKKFSPEIKDNQVKHTYMPLFEHILICGKTKSGKTQTLANLIERSSRNGGTYRKIFMVVKKMEEMTRFLKAELGDKLEIFFDVGDFPSVKEFPDLSEKNNDKWLVIFDDCVNDTDKRTEKKIREFYTFGRAKGICCVYLSQSYFDTDRFIRKQMSWILLCGINSNRDLSSICREYSIGDVDVEQMKAMYDYAKQQTEPNEINFLKICTYHCPIEKKFSKNWGEYLSPSNFLSKEEKKLMKKIGKNKKDYEYDDVDTDDDDRF